MAGSTTNLLTLVQVSHLLQVSVMTLRRRIYDGTLPHHRIGNRILFTQSDIEAFVESCAIASLPISK